MKKDESDVPKLTKNDKTVLKKMLDSEKIPNSKIAEDIGISPQAVFKIREKLEKKGIITGYRPIIDFKKVGISILTLLVVRLSSRVWKNFSDDEISDTISKAPYLIEAYRLNDQRATHILLLAFRSKSQQEKYVSEIQTKFSDEVHIESSYTFSVDNIISRSPIGILQEVIDKREFSPSDIFLNHAPD